MCACCGLTIFCGPFAHQRQVYFLGDNHGVEYKLHDNDRFGRWSIFVGDQTFMLLKGARPFAFRDLEGQKQIKFVEPGDDDDNDDHTFGPYSHWLYWTSEETEKDEWYRAAVHRTRQVYLVETSLQEGYNFDMERDKLFRLWSSGGQWVVWEIHTQVFCRWHPFNDEMEVCEVNDDDHMARYWKADDSARFIGEFLANREYDEADAAEEEDWNGIPLNTIFVNVQAGAGPMGGPRDLTKLVYAKMAEAIIKSSVHRGQISPYVQSGIMIEWPVPHPMPDGVEVLPAPIDFYDGTNWQDRASSASEHHTLTDTEPRHLAEQCVVCINEYEDGDAISKWRCGHSACKPCRAELMNQGWFNCPTCRLSRTTRDIFFKKEPDSSVKK